MVIVRTAPILFLRDPVYIEPIYTIFFFSLSLFSPGWPNLLFWVGGTDTDHEGVWTYVNGNIMPMGAPYWALNNCDGVTIQPDGYLEQNCAALDGTYYYYMTDKECDFQMGHPICYYP